MNYTSHAIFILAIATGIFLAAAGCTGTTEHPPAGSGSSTPAEAPCSPRSDRFLMPEPQEIAVPISVPYPGVRYALNESDSARTITLNQGEILEITLPAIPGLAFRWFIPVTGSGLALMNYGTFTELPDNFNYSADSPLFYPGKYRLRYRAVSSGTSVFDGVFCLDPCDCPDGPRFNLTVTVV